MCLLDEHIPLPASGAVLDQDTLRRSQLRGHRPISRRSVFLGHCRGSYENRTHLPARWVFPEHMHLQVHASTVLSSRAILPSQFVKKASSQTVLASHEE